MNVTIMMGRLVRDPELRYTASGKAVVNFSIAVQSFRENEPSFFDVVAFGRRAENVTNFFSKGDKILIEGHLKQERWVDRNGNKRSRVKIVMENFHFPETKKDDSHSDSLPENDEEIPF